MFAPAACSAGTMSSDGASRMSSVLGLKVRPSTPIVRPATEPPQKSMTFSAIFFLRALFTSMTCSTMVCGAFASRAVWASASVSLGKHEPPKPGPGCRNLRPMRPSRPMPRATSCTSAPTFSQRSAISLMKVILVARKALAAYLMSSAVSMLVNTIGVSIRLSGR